MKLIVHVWIEFKYLNSNNINCKIKFTQRKKFVLIILVITLIKYCRYLSLYCTLVSDLFNWTTCIESHCGKHAAHDYFSYKKKESKSIDVWEQIDPFMLKMLRGTLTFWKHIFQKNWHILLFQLFALISMLYVFF